MFVPVHWLRDYVEIEGLTLKELEDGLILSGSNTEAARPFSRQISGVVVGEILSIEEHPDADKLLVMKVDGGGEVPLTIVTGAKNLSVGDKTPLAVVGAKLPGGLEIGATDFRGVTSEGMLLSMQEMGFEEALIPEEVKEGIMILDADAVPGEDVNERLGLEDVVIEFEITPNRPDCLSMVGMARETHATFDRPLRLPEVAIRKAAPPAENEKVELEITAEDLCPRYMARLVKNVKIEPSPVWMQMRLIKAGMRPINNIVDITNYVMLEFGQPIHAFDFDQVAEGKIVVRRAENQEVLRTLDGKDRTLNDEMLVIADPQKALAIAGVMGGEESEITENTSRLLIEVACFEKSQIRRTSKALGLRSEASSRFEKGVSAEWTPIVADRVCQLIETLGAGEVIDFVADAYPVVQRSKRIPFRPDRLRALIGIDLDDQAMYAYLERLAIEVEETEEGPVAIVPHHRLDLVKEIDLVEEVARLYGYDRIPRTLPKMDTWGGKTNAQEIEDLAKEALTAAGHSEIVTYSFVSPSQSDALRLGEHSLLRDGIRLINPLGEEYSMMRTTLLANLLEVMSRNDNRSIEELALFEIGNVFFKREGSLEKEPIEKRMLAMGLYGGGRDFFALKGAVETLFKALGIQGVIFEREENHPTFHPGRCATVRRGNHILGTLGELHPLIADDYGLKNRTQVAELDFNLMMQMTRREVKYEQLPVFPSITRDLALIVDEVITHGELSRAIEETGSSLLESVVLFDVYRGEQVGEGKKSMAYRLSFRSPEKTLTDDMVTADHDAILAVLSEKFNAQLR